MQGIGLGPSYGGPRAARAILPSDLIARESTPWIGRGDAPPPLSGPLARAGSLEVRLASTAKEVRGAQRLRYRVFVEERGATPSLAGRLLRRDGDAFDPVCDHLIVLDGAAAEVVGTYRLLRRDVADAHFGFYSAAEYDLDPFLAARPDLRILELGRSCVSASHRSRKTVALLWQGISAYVAFHRIDAIIGCASLDGTRIGDLAQQLSYLHHYASSPPAWRVRALEDRRVAMAVLAREAVDPRAAFKALPPLVKGYLRCGAHFGDGAVIDREFGTTDVFGVMPLESLPSRVLGHFGPSPNRYTT